MWRRGQGSRVREKGKSINERRQRKARKREWENGTYSVAEPF